MNNSIQNKVNLILNTAQGNTLDICYTLYFEYVRSAEKPAEILQQILQFDNPIGTEDAPPEKIGDERRDQIGLKYYRLLREIVRFIANENFSSEEFYQSLYEHIFTSSLFPQNDEDRAVILWLLVDKIQEVPYYQAIGLLEKSNEEYRDAITRIKPQLKQAIHMLNRYFSSRTEETSQLVRISSEIKDNTDLIVFWSALHSLIQKSGENESDN